MKEEMATKKYLKRTLEICTFLGVENGFLNMTLKSETKEKKSGLYEKVNASYSKNHYNENKKVNNRQGMLFAIYMTK